ncbi:MAG TPA: DUF3108 domain-containing protein [Flavobacteriales bacterium]|jgi:hypothetical protein|nr:DUF3108 domain-containing protein [Flavobacteriales bacterium]
MKKIILLIFIIFSFQISKAQDLAYKPGEHFKFKIHYGFFNAGYATLDLKNDQYNGQNLYHAVGKGWTTGLSRWFMKVNDLYESYFDEQNRPHRFVRKIDEGGYTMDKELFFDHQHQKVLVVNKKKKTSKKYNTRQRIHDMVSVFYYLRNYDTSKLKPGDEISVDLFFDEEVYPFKLKFLGKDVLNTKMGKIHSLKFRPLVQSGRVFREDESLTVWVSDDANKIPLLIKAKLLVGSLKASLMEYSGLKHPVNFKF